MPIRVQAALIFAAFGALAALAVVWVRGVGDAPDQVVALIPLSALGAALAGWLWGHRFKTPSHLHRHMTGAVVLLGAQVIIAALAVLYFAFGDALSAGKAFGAFSTLLIGSWGVGAIYQVICGAAAGWLLQRLNGRLLPDDMPDED